MKTGNNIDIVECVLINLEDSSESKLFEREDSKCHFREGIHFGQYIIQLRLDWTDMRNNEPVLDADIYVKPKSSRSKLRNGSWHHTVKRYNTEIDGCVYLFEFQSLRLRLSIRRKMAIALKSDVRIVEKIVYKITRKNQS